MNSIELWLTVLVWVVTMGLFAYSCWEYSRTDQRPGYWRRHCRQRLITGREVTRGGDNRGVVRA
jgi:hypothetical protein